MSNLVFLGDLAPTGLTDIEWEPLIDGSALVVANLETPLCAETIRPSNKAGPSLRASPAILPALRRPFAHLALSLANNHIMDFGEKGLEETIGHCNRQGISTFGAGADLQAADAPVLLRCGEIMIAVIAAAERQFGIATSVKAGVAPLNARLYSRIREARSLAERVVVSLHGAAEMSPWPAPAWRELARACAEAGADWVHGHHAHVPQGYERWGKSWIIYSSGNTVVNPVQWPRPSTRISWCFTYDPASLGSPPKIETWSVESIGKGHAKVMARPHDQERETACQRPLSDEQLLEALWQTYALHLWNTFYSRSGLDYYNMGWRERIRFLLKVLVLGLPNPRKRDAIIARRLFDHHMFACDHHREALATALGVLSGELTDLRTQESASLARQWMPK